MTIKSIIIDDEPLAINLIKNYIDELDHIEAVSTFNNPIQAINFLKENPVDLIFLDINMPVLDGLSFIKSLEIKPLIIITTAYKEYAAETYELDVVDYLVKPISISRFMKSVDKAFNILKSKSSINSIEIADTRYVIGRTYDQVKEEILSSSSFKSNR